MHKFIIISGLVLASPLVAQSTPPLPGARESARISGGNYTVDPGHTLVKFQVNHFGFNDYFGIFGDATGKLVLDPKRPGDAVVDIVIPVSKVMTASAGLTAHLLRPGKDGRKADFFGPAPADAHFVSTKVVVKGMSARISGNLTLNGVTAPVVLDATFRGAGINPYNKKETIGFDAVTMIKRSAFGITTAIPLVADNVALQITVAFEKAA